MGRVAGSVAVGQVGTRSCSSGYSLFFISIPYGGQASSSGGARGVQGPAKQ